MTIPQQVREFLSANGKKGGATNKKKGSEYFKYVVSHRKNMQKPAPPKEDHGSPDNV